MINFGILLAILVFSLLHLISATNYCDPALCTNNHQVKRHIGCKNNGKFFSYCEEPSTIPIIPQLRETILHTHNDLRNKVANGTLPRFESAQRMTTMTWDTELEYLAGLNVLQCEMEHDECHNTDAYKYSGQNLAIQYQTIAISPNNYESIIIFLINSWFDEHKDANQGDTDRCTARGLAKNIGHFTAMVQEKSAKVGCGISKFKRTVSGIKRFTILLACNYSFTNMIDMPIYVKGRKCSACQTGCNPVFNGLCSVKENVPPIHDDEVPRSNVRDRIQNISPDRNDLTAPTMERTPSGLLRPSNANLHRPLRQVPSERLAGLMRTAERVVRPYNPDETFYIRYEPNPEIRTHEIIRYVPTVTWRGPRTGTPPAVGTAPIPNPEIRTPEVIRYTPPEPWRRPQTGTRSAVRIARIPFPFGKFTRL